MDPRDGANDVTGGIGFDSPTHGIGDIVFHKGNGQRGVVTALTYNPALMYGVAYGPGVVIECAPQELQAHAVTDWPGEDGDCEAEA